MEAALPIPVRQMTNQITAARGFHRRLAYGVAALAAIISGITLRMVPLGLPYYFVKYGGGVIWGAMVYAMVAFCLPLARIRTIVLSALIVALLSELFRLYQTPELDAFRRTIAGQLLLGRIFSLWNVVGYSLGILLAAAGDRLIRRARAQDPARESLSSRR